MLYIDNQSTDPHFNLALEEYSLKHLSDKNDYFILWQNRPSVIIGRNQNTIEEVNQDYIKANEINVVRRLSGGGAVYHDLGNLNFTFIVNSNNTSPHNFEFFTKPVINALSKLGIEAKFTGRNDIVIDDKKFSGNAQYYYKNRVLHHGTILFNSNLSVVQSTLNVKQDKIQSKGVKSVKSRVTNIYPYLTEPLSINQFKNYLVSSILGEKGIKNSQYLLEQSDIEKINKLMEERYLRWEWNYGQSPKFDVEKHNRYDFGGLDIRLNVVKGVISDCRIFGDFFGNSDISVLEELLRGQKYDIDAIRPLIDSLELHSYIRDARHEDFLDCLF